MLRDRELCVSPCASLRPFPVPRKQRFSNGRPAIAGGIRRGSKLGLHPAAELPSIAIASYRLILAVAWLDASISPSRWILPLSTQSGEYACRAIALIGLRLRQSAVAAAAAGGGAPSAAAAGSTFVRPASSM